MSRHQVHLLRRRMVRVDVHATPDHPLRACPTEWTSVVILPPRSYARKTKTMITMGQDPEESKFGIVLTKNDFKTNVAGQIPAPLGRFLRWSTLILLPVPAGTGVTPTDKDDERHHWLKLLLRLLLLKLWKPPDPMRLDVPYIGAIVC